MSQDSSLRSEAFAFPGWGRFTTRWGSPECLSRIFVSLAESEEAVSGRVVPLPQEIHGDVGPKSGAYLSELAILQHSPRDVEIH